VKQARVLVSTAAGDRGHLSVDMSIKHDYHRSFLTYTHVLISPRHRRHDAGLRLQQPQQEPRPSRPRSPASQSDLHRNHHCRLPLRWRRRHCRRHTRYLWAYRSRQGISQSPPSHPSHSEPITVLSWVNGRRTAKSSTTSPLRSGAPALAQPPTPSSPPPSFPPTSNSTPSPPAANPAL